MDPPPSPQVHSPSGHISALTLNSPRPSSPSPEQRQIKATHPRPADPTDQDGDDDAVPHKRQCTDADHADGDHRSRVKKEPGLANAGEPVVVKEEKWAGDGFPLAAVKKEPRDVVMADVKVEAGAGDEPAAAGMKEVKQELADGNNTEPESSAAAANAVEVHTQYVYRSVYATKTNWDRFVPVSEGDAFDQFGPHCVLRSSGTEATATIRNPQDHVLLKWHRADRTLFISYSLDLAWSIYFQLKHEFFHFELGHVPRYAEAMEWRDLYACEIPDDDLHDYEFTDSTAINYSNTQELLLGRLQVRVLKHERVVIPNKLRRVTMKWCQERHDEFGTYPYTEWRSYIASYAEKHLQAALDPVAMWKEGKSDEEVKKAIEDGLKKHSTSASAYLD